MMTPILIRDAARFAAISAILFFQFSALVFAAPAKVETYNELVNAIREVRAASQQRIAQAVSQEKVREAWETGKLIDEHILLHKERAEYGKQVITKLAIDLGTSGTELRLMLDFFRSYPICPSTDKLPWGHYRELLSVNDSKEREKMASQAVSHKWSQKELRREIKKLKSRGVAVSPGDAPLEAKPGTSGTYRVLKATVGEYKGELVLDLGFSNFFKPEGRLDFREGDIVTSVRDTKGNVSLQIVPSPHPLPGGEEKGEGALNAIHPPPSDFLYTYKADVVEVIDGDTLKVSIPLGFGFTTVQKLRLRGLDAPEIESAEGKEAKAFLEQKLRSAEAEKQEKSLLLASGLSVSPVLIRTTKSDKYDRYLADVWVAGQYLNQALIDEGLAVRVNE